jgi:hypothetical protein
MLETFALFWKMIAKPIETFEYIKAKKPLYATIAYLFIFGAVSYFYSYASLKYLLSPNAAMNSAIISEFQKEFSSILQSYINSPLAIILILISPFILTFITTGIFSLAGEFFTKRTDGIALFTSFTFASVPSLISKLINAFMMNFLGSGLSYLFTILFLVWGIILYILAIEKVFAVNRKAALGIFFIPIIIIIGLILLYSTYLLGIISPLFQSTPGV